ncbi:hypothetical protein SPONN_292 [uncultured Candidatus Thioglobus sp.]|nr:hypothetical protein SPONN_292 [uncultured Candidatus Thioglobus sp.]
MLERKVKEKNVQKLSHQISKKFGSGFYYVADEKQESKKRFLTG